MLTRVSLVGSLGTVYVDYAHSSSSGYILDDIDGLGPPPGVVSVTDYALVPGGRYLSSTVAPRNIVTTIELSPNNQEGKSVKQLRRELMSRLPIGESLTLVFHEEGPSENLMITGYLETFDTDMFSKKPTVTLSIVCPEPYFLGVDAITHGPFDRGGQTIYYEGDAPTGFTIAVDLRKSDISTLYVRETPQEGDYREIYVRSKDGNFRSTRDLVINTRVGRKSAHLRGTSSGTWLENVIGDLTLVEGWPTLYPGPNSIRVLNTPSEVSDDIQWTVSYRNLYGGF